MDNNIPIEEYFKYHPPTTEIRQVSHSNINETALQLAVLIGNTVKDPDCKKQALAALLQCKMWSNLGATVDELRQQYTGN